jgi:hypothetical protein
MTSSLRHVDVRLNLVGEPPAEGPPNSTTKRCRCSRPRRCIRLAICRELRSRTARDRIMVSVDPFGVVTAAKRLSGRAPRRTGRKGFHESSEFSSSAARRTCSCPVGQEGCRPPDASRVRRPGRVFVPSPLGSGENVTPACVTARSGNLVVPRANAGHGHRALHTPPIERSQARISSSRRIRDSWSATLMRWMMRQLLIMSALMRNARAR